MDALVVEGVTKSFHCTQVLRGVDVSLEKGRVLSIIGPSGGGKTTLLRCITGLEVPDGGRITVDGEAIFDGSDKTKVSARERRRRQLKMGLVFQQFNLFPQYNALDNVTLAVKLLARDRSDYRANRSKILSSIEEDGKKLLDKVGLSDKYLSYPGELSGGQQQRVAIARALALNPKVLCFDEPTSALDPELTGEVLSVIKELAEEKMTMVVVTHEMNFARDISDTVLFMDEGKPAVMGPPEYVFSGADSPRLTAFLRA